MKQVIGVLLLVMAYMCNYAQGTMAVKVRDVYTGYAVEATIELQSTDTLISRRTANLNEVISEGKYMLNIYADGYEKQATAYTIKNGEQLSITALLSPLAGFTNKAPENSYSFYVSDERTGLPLAGVQVVLLTENKKSITDNTGLAIIQPTQFTDTDNPLAQPVTTDIEITKQGYGRYVLKDVVLVKSSTSFQVPLSVIRKSAKYPHHLLNKSVYEEQQGSAPIDLENVTPTAISREACTPDSTIRVGNNCNCTTCSSVQQMSLESYVQSGLENEWISSWNAASLQAGAIAYRSYGAYFINNPVAANYDIANTTCNQVWDATTAASCVTAANATSGMVLSNSSGDIFKSEYSAETNNHNCGDCFSGETPNWPCISDNVCCGTTAFGHGRGMCQWGSKRWGDAPNAKTFAWILNHYYNPGGVIVCGTCAPVANDNCGTAVPLNITGNCMPTQGTLLCATDDNYPNPPTCDGFSNPAQRGVFYSFTASSNAVTLTVDPTGSGGNAVDGVVTVYKGSSCTTLQEHACFGGGGNGGGLTKTETITGLTIGNIYYVRVYDYGTIAPGFPEFSICVTGTQATGVSEFNKASLHLYPNPNNGTFTVSANDTKGPWALHIYNVLGQTVYTTKGEGQILEEQVKLQATAKGIYFLHLAIDGNDYFKKLEVF
jgi:hypothetical protein